MLWFFLIQCQAITKTTYNFRQIHHENNVKEEFFDDVNGISHQISQIAINTSFGSWQVIIAIDYITVWYYVYTP